MPVGRMGIARFDSPMSEQTLMQHALIGGGIWLALALVVVLLARKSAPKS
jgi:hypothetical protein